MSTYPEDTDSVVRTVGRAVRLDHTEHTVELPVDEEDNEQVVRVPEPLEVRAAAFLNREPNHEAKGDRHNPASGAGAGDEVGCDEREDLLAGRLRVGVDHGKLSEVDHVGDNVHDGEDDDGPGNGLVERNVLVEGDERVQGRAAQQRDEVAANWEEDERDIDVEDERSGTGDRFGMEEGGLGLGGLDSIGCQGTYGRLHRTSRGR